MSDTLPTVHPTTLDLLEAAARRVPESEALVCGPDRLTYREYLACVRGLAGNLGRVCKPGDRVVLLMANSVDICVALFAVQAARLQATPLNPGFTAGELAPLLENAEPTVIIHDEVGAAVVDKALAESGLPAETRRIVVGDGPGAERFTRWRGEAPEPLSVRPEPEDIAALQYTGGTTGRSKGVELTQRAICVNISQREVLLPTQPDGERILCVAPLFHVYAIAMCLHLSAYCGGTLVILPRYRPDWTLDALERERITLFSGNPTIYSGLLGFPGVENTDFTALRLCFSGAAALPDETRRRWEALVGVRVCEGFGQTEAGPVLTFNPAEGPRKPGSAGLPLPGVRLKIVDTETGETELPVGQPGEICAAGPNLMMGYRGLPDETGKALRDGWLHTGDIGSLDEEGFLFIRDRLKDMVVTGGFNVYPRELEELLHRHPDVEEVAVIGVPDDYLGEHLHGFIKLRQGAAADAASLHAWCSEHLVKYKRPKDFTLMPRGLPKTAAGKIDKNDLRRAWAKAPVRS